MWLARPYGRWPKCAVFRPTAAKVIHSPRVSDLSDQIGGVEVARKWHAVETVGLVGPNPGVIVWEIPVSGVVVGLKMRSQGMSDISDT